MKQDISHRINKTDFVISMNFDNQYQEYQKVSQLIILSDTKDNKMIYEMASMPNVKDIIDMNSDINYVVKRMKGVIQK